MKSTLNRRTFLAVAPVALGLAAHGLVGAETPKPTITIQVTDMCCVACAQKIARKLYTVPGVVHVQANLKANTALVATQQNVQPSSKKLWEAVEAAGFKVVMLQTPQHKYGKKPR